MQSPPVVKNIDFQLILCKKWHQILYVPKQSRDLDLKMFSYFLDFPANTISLIGCKNFIQNRRDFADRKSNQNVILTIDKGGLN